MLHGLRSRLKAKICGLAKMYDAKALARRRGRHRREEKKR